MEWHYDCPRCGAPVYIDWMDRHVQHACHQTKRPYWPPGPAEQRDAYVDTHSWPVEMERVVLNLKGVRCTVPGCQHRYETLDHRVPWARGGPTSVNNLWPMCNEHNRSKGDTDYQSWLMQEGLFWRRYLAR